MEPRPVIVEHVEPGSAAEKAGLQCGDHLISYAGRTLISPHALLALEATTFGHEAVTVCGERDGRRLEFMLPPGKMGAAVRPELPGDVLAEYEQGREQFQAGQHGEAAAIWSAIAPEVLEAAGRAWLYLRAGEAARDGSDWQTGKALCLLASDLFQEGDDSAATVIAWAGIGGCSEAMSDLAAAEHWYEQARQINEAEDRPLWVAVCLNALGNVAHIRGDLEIAEDYYRRSLDIDERYVPDSMRVGVGLNNLGDIAVERSDLEAAAEYHTRALAIWERLAPDTLYRMYGLNGLFRVAIVRGQLAAGRKLCVDALETCRRFAPHSEEMAMMLNNMASLCEREGDIISARDYINSAVEICEGLMPDSPRLACYLDNLGQVAFALGEPEAAQGYHRRALTIFEATAPRSLEAADVLDSLGHIALKRRDFGTAHGFYEQALEIREQSAPDSLPGATSLDNLGRAAFESGSLVGARAYHERALAVWKRLAPGSLESASAREGLGWLAIRQGRAPEAVDHFRQAVEIVEQQRSQFTTSEARALLLAKHVRKYTGLLQSYLTLDDIGNAFLTLERSRARSLLELLAARTLDMADAPPEMLREQQDIDRQRTQAYERLGRLTGAAENAGKIEALHRILRELERSQQELTARVRAASPRYADLQYPQPLSLGAAQALLEPGTLLLSYLVDDDQTFLFAVTATRAEAHVLPVGREALQEHVRSFRQALNRERLTHDPRQEAAFGRGLYSQLIQPVKAAVRRADRLLICPDGPLHTLPFGALVTNARGTPKYLGAQKPLNHILSATTYAQARAARPQTVATTSRLLAFGDPLYGTSAPESGPASADDEMSRMRTRGLSLAPLPHTRAEVEGLARLFGDAATVHLGTEATKTAVLRESGDTDLLHFACHAWFDPSLPLSSGLVLSRPEAPRDQTLPEDNGLLQAWEIFQKLTLSADLVVLSACQSGLGQEVRGEGLVGLTRAFQYAGARSLVVSLWDVNDASTCLFMQAFYAALRSGTSKDAALRQGVLALQAEPRWNAPSYWGAFVLIGDGH